MLKITGFLAQWCAAASAIFLAVASGSTAVAADYFAGKTIRMVVGGSPNSGYALYGQLAVQHLGRFIPGNPSVVVSYSPGASGVIAMNNLYGVAPRDGTVVGVAMQDLASLQVLGVKGIRFNATKFNYIGRVTANVPVHMVWHTAPAQSIDDLRTYEIVTGASSINGTHADLPRAQNALLGMKWKIVAGYREFNERHVAMERGEIQAAVTAATLFNEQLKPWLEHGKVRILVQYADFRHPLFADVPAIVDIAATEEARRVFKFLVSLSTVGRSYLAPPGVPGKIVAILRNAFTAMINDPAFKADAAKRGADLLPMSGEQLAAYVAGIVRTPSDIIRKTNEVIAAR